MILLIRRKWVLGAAALLLAVVSLLSLAERPRAAIPAFSYDALPTREVVIIDAGHGGSDGGAVSTDGTPESGINLAVALRLRDFLALTIFFVVFSSAEFPLTFVPLLGTMGAMILLWEVRPCGS